MREDIKNDIKEIKDDISEIKKDFRDHESWEESFLKKAFDTQTSLILQNEENKKKFEEQKELNKEFNKKINICFFCIISIYIIILVLHIWKI